MLENLVITVVIALVGGLIGWQASVRLEKHRERYEERKEHRDSIREKVLKPMRAALESYSSGVRSMSSADSEPLPMIELATDNVLYTEAYRHYPNLFAAWREYENDHKTWCERRSLLRSTVKEYLEQGTGLAVMESPSEPPWISAPTVGLVCREVLGLRSHERPLREMQPLPGGLMPGGGEADLLGFNYQAVYGQGRKAQMELLRDVISQGRDDPGIRECAIDFIDIGRRLQAMQPQLKQRILEALEEPHLSGRCEFCP